jgi:hypothetical protein
MDITKKSGDFSSTGFWESNKKILSEQYGGLLDEITSENGELLSPEDIKIEITPPGEPSLCVKGIYVHSPRDPLREGQRLAQAADSGSGPVVVLGFGLGYAAQAVAKIAAASGRPVIVVEKYANLLRKAMELRDFGDFLSNNRIIFVVGGTGEGITGALGIANELVSAENADKKPSVIRNKALTDIDEKWYGAVEDRIRTWTMRDDVNTATLKRFGRRWVHNLSRNMTVIRDFPGISRLADLAAAVIGDTANEVESPALPVFLAAAGPSLDRIGSLLRDIYRRCIVVAVDTNLRFFVKNGIEPDFVLVVDPQFWNSRHLDFCSCERTALIAESAVYPPVLRLPFKNIFLCGSLFPLGMFIEKQVDPKGRLGAGGSVATTAWDFARILGGSEIWIAGLDLAYPNLKTHFRGARFEERANSLSCRLNPTEKWVTGALRDGIPFKARSATGEPVLTDRRLSLYAAWFENQFRKYPQVKNFGVFRDGLEIAGLQSVETDALLSLPERRDEIDKRLDEAFLKTEKEFNESEQAWERAKKYENAVSGLKRGLASIKKTAEDGASIARQALKRELNAAQKDKVIKDLDALTRRVTESEVKEVAGFLLPLIDDDKERSPASGSDPFRTYLNSTLKLFSGLAQAAEIDLT